MRSHQVTVYDAQDNILATRWAATAAEGKELKTQLMEEYEITKKDRVTVEVCEIPMDKAGLLGWINDLAAKADMVENDEEAEEEDEDEEEEEEEEE